MKPQTSTMSDAANTAKMLSEALPYLQRYSGAVVVVKFGGNAMGDDAAMAEFARDIVLGQRNSIGSQFAALSSVQIAALTSDQITSIETRDLSTLKSQQITALTDQQISVLTTAQINALTNSQVGSLTAEQISAFTTVPGQAPNRSQMVQMAPIFMLNQEREDGGEVHHPPAFQNGAGAATGTGRDVDPRDWV